MKATEVIISRQNYSPDLSSNNFFDESKAIILLDKSFIIHSFNSTAEKIFGWPKNYVTKKNFLHLLKSHQLEPPFPDTIITILTNTEKFCSSSRITNLLGDIYHVKWYCQFITFNHAQDKMLLLIGDLENENKIELPTNEIVNNLFNSSLYKKAKLDIPDKDYSNQYESLIKLIQFMPGCCYMKNHDGAYIGGNSYMVNNIIGINKFSDIYGYNDVYVNELIGKRWPDDFYLSIQKDDEDVLKNNKFLINKPEVPFLDTRGRVIIQRANKIPMLDETGKVAGLFGISLDISNQIPLFELKKTYAKLHVDIKIAHQKFLGFLTENSASEKITSLTERELDCLLQLSMGRSNKEIAFYNDISPKTIEKHIEHMKEKMSCNSRSQLVSLLYTSHATGLT